MSPDSSRVVGRYLLCDAIASGGMATVYLGRLLGPVGFSRTVAIKRLHAHFARDPEFVAMFLDEARLAARIRHPNVVSTLDIVVLQGELFVVMDYVHGEALSRLLKSGAVPVPVACSVIAGVLYGLHAAHEAKTDEGVPLHIVHRDVSPQNVLVGTDGTARVVDFGVAKAVGRLQTTREGALKGKISYMSPEQVSADSIDRRTDIYAASVVLWEMLTGQRLFRSDNEVRIIQQVIAGKINPPSKYTPGIPAVLDALVMRGLAKDADERFRTAWDMAEEVQRVAFATPGQVSDWVKRLATPSIEERARKIAEVESGRSAPPPPLSPREEMGDDGDADETVALQPRKQPSMPMIAAAAREGAAAPGDSEVSALNVSSRAGRRTTWIARAPLAIVAVAGASLLAGAAAAVLALGPRSAAKARDSSSDPAVATAGVPAPATASVTAPTPAPAVAPSATPAIAATVAATASADAVAERPAPHEHPATTAPHRTHASRPECNPPYTIKDGIRMPKMECL